MAQLRSLRLAALAPSGRRAPALPAFGAPGRRGRPQGRRPRFRRRRRQADRAVDGRRASCRTSPSCATRGPSRPCARPFRRRPRSPGRPSRPVSTPGATRSSISSSATRRPTVPASRPSTRSTTPFLYGPRNPPRPRRRRRARRAASSSSCCSSSSACAPPSRCRWPSRWRRRPASAPAGSASTGSRPSGRWRSTAARARPSGRCSATPASGCKVMRVPVTFPPEPFPHGEMLSGLGTPDLSGRIGKPFYFTSELFLQPRGDNEVSVEVVELSRQQGDDPGRDQGAAEQALPGQVRPTSRFPMTSSRWRRTSGRSASRFRAASSTSRPGEWSDWVQLRLPVQPAGQAAGHRPLPAAVARPGGAHLPLADPVRSFDSAADGLRRHLAARACRRAREAASASSRRSAG